MRHLATVPGNFSRLFLALVQLLALALLPARFASADTGLTALHLNGTNQYVTFGKALGLGTPTFTLEVWFRRDGAGVSTSTGTGGVDAIPLLTKGRAEADGSNVDMNYFLGIRSSDNVLTADFEEGAGAPSPGLNHPIAGVTPIALNTWYHAAAAYDGTTWQLFLNGSLERQLTVGRPPRADSIQHAGLGTALNSLGQAAGFFAGTLDEARIWNYARSAAQVQATMNQELASAPGLIARWGLNEGIGTVANDSAGSAINGTLMNGAQWAAGYPFTTAPTPDTTPPAAPQGLIATAGNGSVSLTWAANTEADLAGYNVYRSTASPVSTTGSAVNATLLTTAAYTDNGLTNGTTYYYVVVAVDTSNNRSSASNQVSAAPQPFVALHLNGTNQYVTFGKALGLGTPTFTLEVWFRRDGAGVSTSTGTGGVDAIPLLTKGRAEADGSNVDMNYFLGIRSSDNVLTADFEEGAGAPSPGLNHPIAGVTPIALNTWYHAAAAYDGTTWQLFLNGSLERQLTVGRPPRADSIQHAGLGTALNSLGQAAGFFAGTLDEARIWNYARSAAQVQATMNQELASAPGLIARWGLNEGIGTVANDSAGSAINGTLMNGAQWAAGYPFTTAPARPAPIAPAIGAEDVPLSPTLDVVVTDPDDSALTVTFYGAVSGSTGYSRIGSVGGVQSGSHATVTWQNLAAGQAYTWFARVSDGVGVATGPTWSFRTAGASGEIFVGAGDIASCTSQGDEATAELLDSVPGTVFTLGDNAYQNASAADFTDCYDASWGRQKARTRPAAGNHEYQVDASAAGYFGYFGTAAGDPTKGYYSFDLGSWHIVVLNANCDVVGGCQAGSPQEVWLRTDLAAHPSTCTLAMWHQARFSSDLEHPSDPTYQAFWQALYFYDVDLVIAGHSHGYERFAPQTATGAADPVRGIREFVAGTGGASHTTYGPAIANSEVRNDSTYGVLKLTLKDGGYDFQFVPVAGETFTDAGSGSCH